MAGTIPFALQQQVDQNGRPLAGAFLYLFVSGSVSTLASVYQDYGLSIPAQNPLIADITGRIPMFWLADGTIHPRLTDAYGNVIQDIPVMQVLGPSSGSGGGGSSVDPTTIFATGDVKFRATSETLTGWVKMNGLTIGSPTSGATGRANNDTQNLFIYLWTNFTNTQCPVSGGRGSTALADFQANKTIGIPDWRARSCVGLDDMGNVAAGILTTVNFPNSSDGPTTPDGYGGEATHQLLVSELAQHAHGVTDPGHTHVAQSSSAGLQGGPSLLGIQSGAQLSVVVNLSATTGISVQNTGGNQAHNICQPFVLGTYHMKL